MNRKIFDEYTRKMQERLDKGSKLYGEDNFLKRGNIVESMSEELIDISNYAYMEYYKLRYYGHSTLSFAFETPISILEKLKEDADYQYIIASDLGNERYFDFIKKYSGYKILDNGAYEQDISISSEKLLQYAHALNVDTVITPDKLYDFHESVKLRKNFFSVLSHAEKEKYRFLTVASAKNIPEFFNHIDMIIEDSQIDMLGITQLRNTLTSSVSDVMTYIYRKYNMSPKPIHLLGLKNLYELRLLKYFPEIKSVDTGLPINFGLKNKYLDGNVNHKDFTKIHGVPLTYSETITDEQVSIMKKNIKIMKRMYENGVRKFS